MSKYLLENQQIKAIVEIFSSGKYDLLKPLIIKKLKENAELIDILKSLYEGNTLEINYLLKLCDLTGLDFNGLNEQLKQAFITVNNLINETFRIACFTTTNSNSLMWSHYSDTHTDYCIEYDVTKFDLKFLLLLFPVIYSSNRFLLPFENYINYADGKVTITNDFYNNHSFLKNIIEVLLTKSEIWKYKYEWIIVLLKEKEYLFKLSIKGVYLGTKMSK